MKSIILFLFIPFYLMAQNEKVELYNKAVEAYNLKQYDACVKLLETYEKNYPPNEQTSSMKAFCHQTSKQYKLAEQFYQDAIRFSENPARYYAQLAWMYHSMNDYDKRLKNMIRAVELDPGNARNQYDCGKFKHEASQEIYATAIDNFNAALKVDPDFTDAYVERALYYMTFGKFKKAMEDLLKAKTKGADVESYIEACKFELGE